MSNKVVNMLQQGGSESRGSLQVVVLSEDNRPVENARVQIAYTGEPDNVLEELVTNSSGRTEPINLLTPPLEYSLNPGIEQPYSEYTLRITAEDFAPLMVSIICQFFLPIQKPRMARSDALESLFLRFVSLLLQAKCFGQALPPLA